MFQDKSLRHTVPPILMSYGLKDEREVIIITHLVAATGMKLTESST